MKLTVLSENTTKKRGITAEHGLSLYIETQSHKILFDMGQTVAFAENAKKLDIDLAKVDTAFISHGHYDHVGGLEHFLNINKKAYVYLNKYALMPHFSGVTENVGVSQDFLNNERLIFVDETLEIDDELSVYACNDCELYYPIDAAGLSMLEKGELKAEDFRHEQYLLIQEQDRNILLSGCSHKGILNIAKWFSPQVLIGGFHFMKLDPEQTQDKMKLEDAACVLGEYQTQYYTCHCTGIEAYSFLKGKMGNQLKYLSAGQTVTI